MGESLDGGRSLSFKTSCWFWIEISATSWLSCFLTLIQIPSIHTQWGICFPSFWQCVCYPIMNRIAATTSTCFNRLFLVVNPSGCVAMIKEEISAWHGRAKRGHDKSLDEGVFVCACCCALLLGWLSVCWEKWLNTCIFQLLVCWKHSKDILLDCAWYSNLPGYLWFVGWIPIQLCWILSTQQIQTPKGFC